MHHQSTNVSPAIAKIMADKRDSKRVKSVFSASIHFEGQFYCHCVIQDVSATGMKLKLQQLVDLPDIFEVTTPAVSESITVKKAWVKGEEVGVEYIEIPKAEEEIEANDLGADSDAA